MFNRIGETVEEFIKEKLRTRAFVVVRQNKSPLVLSFRYDLFLIHYASLQSVDLWFLISVVRLEPFFVATQIMIVFFGFSQPSLQFLLNYLLVNV